MFLMERYRSWIVSGAILGTLALGACGDMGLDHDALKSQMTQQWNMTRIGIMYQLAEQQYKVGDYEKCEETLKDAFATKAPFAPMYILAAKIQIEKGNLEPAADYLNTALHINANDPEPYYLLGVLYQRWQKPEVACDYYKQAWAKKPEEARYLLATVEMQISMGQIDEAKALIESKLVYFEQSAALRVALARIAVLKNDYVAAVKNYREAVTLMPDDETLQRSYAETLFYAGEFAQAAPMFEAMRQKAEAPDHANLVMMLGESYLGLRRYQDARNCFQDVIRDKPDDVLAYLNLGKACVQTGDLAMSLSAARKVLRNEPDNVQAMILMALVQQKEKKWGDAQETLEKAGAIAPSDVTVLCMLGVGAQQLGNHQQAIAFYEKAVAADPKDPWATELLGRVRPAAAIRPAAPAAPAAETPAAANTPVSAGTEGSATAAITPVQVSGGASAP